MVDLYFPPSTGVSIIAEPGSFFVSSAFTLAVNVISKEVVARDCQDQAHGQCHDIHSVKCLGWFTDKTVRIMKMLQNCEADFTHCRLIAFQFYTVNSVTRVKM